MQKRASNGEGIARLTAANNRIDGAYYLCARAMGINENKLALLYALDDGRPHTQTQICAEWMMPKTTVNTIVRDLERAGYMTLAVHGREKTLVLTEAGRAYARRLLAPVKAAEEQALAETLETFSPAFIDAYDHFAARLCRALRERSRGGRDASTEKGDDV